MVYMRGLAKNWREDSWLGFGILRTTAMNQIYLFENFEIAVMDWSHVNQLRFDATSNICLINIGGLVQQLIATLFIKCTKSLYDRNYIT